MIQAQIVLAGLGTAGAGRGVNGVSPRFAGCPSSLAIAAGRRPGLKKNRTMADKTVGVPVVELRRAAAALGGRRIWSGVDASVAAGEFVAILGPNGVGKSTLLRAILGLPRRRGFDASLRVRGLDVVRLGVDGDRWGLPLPGADRRARARVRELVELVGAGSYAHRPVGQLSGGEQQRLLIAQALARRPRLVLLDEPLDSLDLPNQAAIAALVSRICRTGRVAVMIVAHDVNPILPYLDRVIYLGPGGAVSGTPAEVITSATLSRLYRTPVEVLSTSDGRPVVVGQPEAPAVHADRHAS